MHLSSLSCPHFVFPEIACGKHELNLVAFFLSHIVLYLSLTSKFTFQSPFSKPLFTRSHFIFPSCLSSLINIFFTFYDYFHLDLHLPCLYRMMVLESFHFYDIFSVHSAFPFSLYRLWSLWYFEMRIIFYINA